MATALKAFNFAQISNPESTPGTAVAATEILYPESITGVTHATVFFQPEQDRNSLAMHAEDQIEVSKEATLTLEGELYDRLAVWMFSNAIRGNVTPTQPDVGTQPNAYEWLFEPSLATTGNTPDETNGIDTFTLEFGDNVDDYEGDYAFTISCEISGAPNEPVRFSWEVQVQDVVVATRTGSLTEPTRKAYFAFNNAQLYIDSSYANLGTTAVDDMMLGFTYTFETMFTARYSASGALTFTGINEGKKSPQLEITYRRDDTNSEAEKTKYLNSTLSFIRIGLFSDGEMDSGQDNPEYIYIDGAYRYTEWAAYEEDDNINVVTPTAMAYLDPTSSKMMSVTVGTTLATYPA